ncbi:hypothetical protein [Halobaculum sp. MBLA0143]|uniref:hypothetical protein n=1 Tax=Halobaculum sp. MBLA0143 TaxID=3079933 RepID=UPI003524FFD9
MPLPEDHADDRRTEYSTDADAKYQNRSRRLSDVVDTRKRLSARYPLSTRHRFGYSRVIRFGAASSSPGRSRFVFQM